MNNRSLRLDTECDMTIDISLSGDTEAGSVVTQIRDSLLAEHLGVPESDVVATMRETGSLIATIEALRAPDRKTLRPFELPDSSKLEGWIADNEILDPEGPKAMFETALKKRPFPKMAPPEDIMCFRCQKPMPGFPYLRPLTKSFAESSMVATPHYGPRSTACEHNSPLSAPARRQCTSGKTISAMSVGLLRHLLRRGRAVQTKYSLFAAIEYRNTRQRPCNGKQINGIDVHRSEFGLQILGV